MAFVTFGMASSRQVLILLALLCYNIHHVLGSAFHPHHSHQVSRADGALLPRASTTSTSGQDGYTCGPGNPCSNGACCGESGWCGYGPTYCGDGCQSNCDATADCGQYAATPGQTCPLNVCCSEYGFCGTTSDFCGSGCQSDCTQPKPSAAASNVQKRIVGYWESWNSQHACGTMSPGEIPVSLLTHLNVAFGYVNSAFQVTNMDGVSPDIYKNVGDVKSRNPSIKLIIALGGWSFSDPGAWQSIFPTLVSSEANRATFIQNLLGFLSEYGYDGVDFDWEYPGADDRGGSSTDGVNYTALLKELRAAIEASGKDYIVTFTAPTSYWYLQHFDLANMVQYTDWVNLMAYDLHGVWDSNDPIGNQVLAHTNLTEIDLALDLFWRVGVDPADIVLGLGFYGRSFQLTDPSCWKPGCEFSGPGEAGSCTSTAGILSYREINQILTTTGATAYLDTEAAVRYLVYGNNSWISFDDATTFKAKIDYANSMGLGGLMVWAVDLDDNNLDALNAISNADDIGAIDNPFTLVDLKYLFPTEDLPAEGTTPNYGLINFGSLADTGSMNPSKTAFGFLLIAGDSYAVTQLRKRDGLPDPFVFLDCPSDVTEKPKDKLQTARVVCEADDVEGCFRVMERGVEGTIIEMPDNCAPNSFARAVSLKLAKDQYVPVYGGRRSPTSQVYEFSFDFNMDLIRRDTNNTSIRLDYSNIQGYWDAIVNTPGIQSRDLGGGSLTDRFFAPTNEDWEKAYSSSSTGVNLEYNPSDSMSIQEDMSAPVFWQTAEECLVDGDDFGEGFGAYVSGSLDASFYYGFSIVATLDGIGSMDVKQANGLLKVTGQTDLTYVIGGMGSVDISKAGKGNPAFNQLNPVSLPGHTVNAGNDHGWVTFDPYYQITYQMATFNGTGDDDFSNSIASFNGLMSTRTISDLGDFEVYYPPLDPDTVNGENDNRNANKISVSSENVLYNSPGQGGKIAIGTYVKFGLKVSFFLFADLFKWDVGLPDMSLTYNTMTEFTFSPSSSTESCADLETITNVFQSVDNAASVNWDDFYVQLAYDRQGPSDADLCYPNADGLTNSKKRSLIPTELHQLSQAVDINNSSEENTAKEIERNEPAEISPIRRQSGNGLMPGWGYGDYAGIDPLTYMGTTGESAFSSQDPKFKCQNCVDCGEDDEDESQKCCGCVCMQCAFGFRDIPTCDECDPINPANEVAWPGPSYSLTRRSDGGEVLDKYDLEDRASDPNKANIGPKNVKVCGKSFGGSGDYRYPSFPKDVTKNWAAMDNGRWGPISAYWGNSSSVCSSWAVGRTSSADRTKLPDGTLVRSDYQTEHVFEGQLIGAFFNQWLADGKLDQQNPAPSTYTPKMPCAVTNAWITNYRTTYPWTLDGGGVRFISLLLAELGSIAHMDRLTIYLSRPNAKKGNLFTQLQPVLPSTYDGMSQEQQLQVVKEFGMNFYYMNTQEVWNKFCATYEAIYDRLGDFDTWFAQQTGTGVTIPNLQDEWKDYIRITLDSLSRNAQASFDTAYNNRRYGIWGPYLDPPYTFYWLYNKLWNRGYLKFTLTCNNMDPTTVS